MVRQWRLLRLLQESRRGMTVLELHARQEEPVSERTVFRDLQALQAAGFHLVSEGGRWRADGSMRVAMPLTEADALGLSLCLETMAPLGPGLQTTHAIAELRAKVETALPEAARALVAELRGTQLATVAAPAATADDVARVLEDGCRKEQSVRIRYRSHGGEETERVVNPYALWFTDGALYVIAHCHLRGAMRHFLVARVLEAELTDEVFERDADFDPRAHVAEGFGVWVGQPYDIELLFSAQVAHQARERRLHPTQEVTALADGAVRVTFRAPGLPALARWVVATGGGVRVVGPPVLRDMVRDMHLAGLEAHGPLPPTRALRTHVRRSSKVRVADE